MIMDYSVRHRIPGRLRLKFKSLPNVETALEQINKLPGVCFVRLNPASRSLVINYDPKAADERALLLAVQRLSGPAHKGQSRELDCACSTAVSSSAARHGLRRFLSLSAVMVIVFIKQVLLKSVLRQTLFSPLGLIALIAVWPLCRQAFINLKQKKFSLDSFLALGCLLATATGQSLTALEILWVESGADSLSAWVAERSRRSIAGILDITAKNTFILVEGVEVEMPVSGVKPRDIVILHTGEKVSVDGEIMCGEALVDDSPITGRAELKLVSKGQKVFAGSYVRQGLIHVRAENVGDHTYLARVMRLVQDSLNTRAPIEQVADRLATSLFKLGLAATALTLLATGNLWRAFTVMLVMACPCATALSARTAVAAALSSAAGRGILIKGGRYLEEVSRADVICFDKTGTLTTNEPRLEKILNFSQKSENDLLLLAYSAEMHNHHPLALAIKKEAQARNIDPVSHVVCDFTLGRGVRAVIGNDEIRLGNRRYMLESGVNDEAAIGKATSLRNKGLTVIFLALNNNLLAAFGFANELKPQTQETLEALKQSGISKISMITGDSKNTALALCSTLTVDDCHYSVLPEEKGAIVAALKQNGSQVIMVGDGINDALALVEADIGIAMSAAGSDVAIEAADIALVNDDLADILFLREHSRKTLRIVHQNFWLATATNLAGALAGAAGILSPPLAGLLHIIHTLGVLANSSRLLKAEDTHLDSGVKT